MGGSHRFNFFECSGYRRLISSQQVIMTWNLSKLKLSTLQTKTVVSFDRIGLDKLENDYAYWQILILVWPPKRPCDIAFIPSKRVQSWQISWIRHLHSSHNAGLMCCPKFCVSVVFNFSRDGCNTQEKWKTKVRQNLGGQMRCFMGHVQVANTGSNQNKAKHSWQKKRPDTLAFFAG